MISGLDALRRAISGLPQVAEAIAAVPANERSKALTAAETSYLQSALELGYSDSEARDWVTALIFAADPGAGASVIRRKGFSAKCKHSVGRLNKQSPRRAKFAWPCSNRGYAHDITARVGTVHEKAGIEGQRQQPITSRLRNVMREANRRRCRRRLHRRLQAKLSAARDLESRIARTPPHGGGRALLGFGVTMPEDSGESYMTHG